MEVGYGNRKRVFLYRAAHASDGDFERATDEIATSARPAFNGLAGGKDRRCKNAGRTRVPVEKNRRIAFTLHINATRSGDLAPRLMIRFAYRLR